MKYTVVRVLSVSVHGIQVSAHVDISKIFGRYLDIQQRFIKLRMKQYRFTKQRTVIVEDTPQNCRYNYGNAIERFGPLRGDKIVEAKK